MHFPLISEITTTDVTAIPETAALSQAIELMLNSEHRHIVVTDESSYYLLSIYDVLRINRERIDKKIALNTENLAKLPTIHKDLNVLDALEYLSIDFEILVVLNDDNSLYGIITHADILSSIDPDTLMDNYRLSDLLKIKKRHRWVDKEILTCDIFNMMEKYNHDAIIIVEDKKPIGIVTTKDMLILLKEHKDLNLSIEQYMVTPVVSIAQNATLNEALQFMQDKHFKRIVTIDKNGDLVGSITQKELISITYAKWVRMIQTYQKELQVINEKLEQKSEKFEKIAAIDPLTGLYNRMKFLELFISEYTIMTQRNNALSLLIMDLDYFKKINDTYGHNIGDEVLKQVSHILLRELRNVDVLCRWGGEEFVALLPATDCKNAYHIAEKIRCTIEELSFNSIPKITISIGVTQIKEGDELHDVIARADKALYSAKMLGRNCVKSFKDISE